MPAVSASIELSPAKSTKKARPKSSEAERVQTVALPVDWSIYSDPSFVKDVTERLLLPTDHKRLNEIGHVKSAE